MAGLTDLSTISIAFEVNRVFDITEQEGSGDRFVLTERKLEKPYVKDYDIYRGEGPLRWLKRFDLSNWGLILAYLDDRLVGGSAIAYKSPDTEMLERRDDLAILWDIRVTPAVRSKGIGTALLRASETWAKSRSCTQMKIETQNVNVPACRFYARDGYVLGAANRAAYSDLPEEIQLLWYKNL